MIHRIGVALILCLTATGALADPGPQFVAAPQLLCLPDDETLCLLDGQLEVQVRFRNQHAGGQEGTGKAVSLGEKAGLFWFFNEQNFEVMVKALDGSKINEAIWIFVGSLSDVEFWVDVTQIATDRTVSYYNPPGNTYGIVDTRAFQGGIGSICGGIAGTPCPQGQICDLEAGQCSVADVAGLCVPDRNACPEHLDPVCGCNGVTYDNDCFRIAAGAQKDHDGPCQGSGVTCGGIAGIPCPQGEICELPVGQCQLADAQGFCVAQPEVCIEIFAPVCGCDGITYDNDCFRRATGVQKNHDGPCAGDGATCGGIAGDPCLEGQFCEAEPGQCFVLDAPGTCRDIPDACILLLAPVCGCDGVTYDNDCFRTAAGVSKNHDGECE